MTPPRAPAHPTDRVPWGESAAGVRHLERTGRCHHPIRLRGRIDALDLATGELRPVYDTAAAEPGGALHVACGNRRESVCPPCSTVYKRDARQLVTAGLAGGQGVPETITGHPCVFATFTAPSFGPVHSRRHRGKTVLPCRPAATRRPAAARTAATSPARPATARTTRGLAARCAVTAMTMKRRCCSTPGPGTCGGGSQ
jgi:hypothetical protein